MLSQRIHLVHCSILFLSLDTELLQHYSLMHMVMFKMYRELKINNILVHYVSIDSVGV